MPSKTVAPLPSKSTRRIIRSAAPAARPVIRRWQPARQDPSIERLRSAYDAQDRNTRNYVLDCSAVDEEVRQAEQAVKRVRREMWRPTWGPCALPESGGGEPDCRRARGRPSIMDHLAASRQDAGGADVNNTNIDIIPATGQMFEDEDEDEDEDNLLEILNRSRDANQVLEQIRQVPKAELMLQAVVTLGEKTNEGQIIEAVAIAWFKIVEELVRDPNLMRQMDWRKMEEMIAAAYEAQGWDEVTLTPRSHDDGRDVIAVRHDFGSIRFVDQVKAYSPGHLVTADDVRSMAGVLLTEPNVSKGIITTTSDFAPGVYQNERLKQLMPTRLDLRNGTMLIEWLNSISKERTSKGSLGGAQGVP
jgi:restriction system protein